MRSKLAAVRKRTARFVSHRETYVWFELSLSGQRPRLALDDGFALVAADDGHLEAFHRLGSTTPPQTAAYLAEGGRPWLVLGDGAPAFGCWIHPHRAPMRALPGGFLDLPAGVACLEDSVTSPDFRGRGVAPRAWAMLADRYEGEGFGSLVTKVMDTNVPSCKAVVKAGFAEVGRMHLHQQGPRVRLRMAADGPGAGPALAERLDGRGTLLLR